MAPHGVDEVKAASHIRQMTLAISCLHVSRIAHRDVNPENLLLSDRTPGAHLKVINFGFAFTFVPGAPMKIKAGTAYYVDGEVLQGSYGEKCDVWSVGVISFILLCGYPPFSGNSDPIIFAKVKKGTFEFKSPEWDGTSCGCKNLITQMLSMDAFCRPAAAELLQHPWLNFKAQVSAGPICKNLMSKLKGFQAATKLKKVALAVLAQQLRDEQVELLQNTFKALDKGGDGVLSPQEVKDGLVRLGIKIPPGLEDILKNVGTSGTGKIDYSEFLAATLGKQVLMQTDLYWEAFRHDS